MRKKMLIRKAEIKDLQSLLDIYNDEVENGVATFDLHPKTMEQWEIWFSHHNIENHLLSVAEKDGKAVGYASLSSYREKEAYRTTVELSLYVAAEYRRQGIAVELMTAILKLAREDDSVHTVVSVITGENEASVRLHERFGFTFSGVLHEVGVPSGGVLADVHEVGALLAHGDLCTGLGKGKRGLRAGMTATDDDGVEVVDLLGDLYVVGHAQPVAGACIAEGTSLSGSCLAGCGDVLGGAHGARATSARATSARATLAATFATLGGTLSLGGRRGLLGKGRRGG